MFKDYNLYYRNILLFKTLHYIKIIVNSININKKKENEKKKADKELKEIIKKHLNNKQ